MGYIEAVTQMGARFRAVRVNLTPLASRGLLATDARIGGLLCPFQHACFLC